jgi:hypothetical protein
MNTNSRVFLPVSVLFYLTLLTVTSAFQPRTDKPKWKIKATYFESCSCNAPCPCPFGLPMTNSFCKLNALLVVHEGSFNKINLKGVKLIMSGSAGKWGAYYFSEEITPEQKRSMEQILFIINPGSFDTVLTSQVSAIQFEDKNGFIRYSTPNIKVEMSTVKGNHHKPVVIQNLKGKLFDGYIPCFSNTNIRAFSDSEHDFAFEKKAGFISTWNFTQLDFK